MKIDTLHTSVAQLQDAGTPLAVYDSQNSAKLPDSELCEEAHFHVGETITSIQVQFNLSIVLNVCFCFCFSCTVFVCKCVFLIKWPFYRVTRMYRMPKLQVSFRERATNCKALLRKMTHEDKASYAVSSPPCSILQCHVGEKFSI